LKARPASKPSTSTVSRRSSGRASAANAAAIDGLHIFEDHFYPEIVDPETGEPLPDGTEGELVLTTLSKQAMPMIRYRTRDITMILPGQCECGRTLRRIGRIGRRSDDMLIIRGVNVFPSQVETALLEIEGTLPHYQILLTREHGLDQMEVQVEVTPHMFNDKIGALQGLHEPASGRARSRAGNPGEGCAGRGAYHRAQPGQGKTRHRQADTMKIHQISLFAENKPGHIAAPARLLAQEGIDIRAMYLADTQQYGILRMIVSDWQKAARVLEEHGFVAKVTEVLAVEVPDRPGGLADVLGALDGTGINIEYMYAFPYPAATRRSSSSASPIRMRRLRTCRRRASTCVPARNSASNSEEIACKRLCRFQRPSPSQLENASWIRRMFEEGVRLKRERGADAVFDFSLGNPDVEPPPAVMDALRRVVAGNRPGSHGYMPNPGYPKSARPSPKSCSRETGLDFTAEDVFMTVGSAGACNVILKSILDPGDEVIVLMPCFSEYQFYIANHGGLHGSRGDRCRIPARRGAYRRGDHSAHARHHSQHAQ
jgi:hypothetical protein